LTIRRFDATSAVTHVAWTYPAFVDTYHRGSVRGKEST
jgi:hypothetical protein